jgi:hypothetical protein
LVKLVIILFIAFFLLNSIIHKKTQKDNYFFFTDVELDQKTNRKCLKIENL